MYVHTSLHHLLAQYTNTLTINYLTLDVFCIVKRKELEQTYLRVCMYILYVYV